MLTNLEPNIAMLRCKIRQTWFRLSEEDIALYLTNAEDFCTLVRNKYNIAQENIEKTLSNLERQCAVF